MFTEGYEGIKGFEGTIHVRDNAKPVYCKPRSVPYALKGEVERELAKLEENGVIKKVSKRSWAAPVVIVPKSDKTVRLCGDYKVTVNQAVEDEQYPLPTSQDLFAAVSGATVFSKLDLSHAYAQVNVCKESQKYLTINTHKGLYSYMKLPYGIKSAPKMFQCIMDKILNGIPNVIVFQDDILVVGSNMEDHLQTLTAVLDRLAKHNIKLNENKCAFMKKEVVYLGYKVNENGLQPLEEKVDAIVNIAPPANVSELRAFLGMVQYYARFLSNLSSILAPLHELLKKDVCWKWTSSAQRSFDACKNALTSASLLVHYDVKKELKLACDASAYGVGAVTSHVLENGEEKPIAFASRTLTHSEKNYAQIEKEALAIIFGVKKFHQYLYGRKFCLVTDHKPLLTILGPKSSVPTLSAARMQRWAELLSVYDYDIEFRRSADHANADALSRLPCGTSKVGQEPQIYSVNLVENRTPVTATKIAQETRKDAVLSKVLYYTLHGWPNVCPAPNLSPFFVRRLELTCESGCILWGMRVIVPECFQNSVLDELYFEHPGV